MSNRKKTQFRRLALIHGLLLLFSGCRTFDWWNELRSDHQNSIQDRDNDAALHINSKGLRYANHGKLGKAESAFHRAIARDPRSAAAHNNLGNLYLSRHELYQAAWEFERAAQISPQSVEPLINLGIVHETADRLDEAAMFYTQALSINANNAIALGNLARVRIQQNWDPSSIASLLTQLVFVDSRPAWIEWAEDLLNGPYQSQLLAGVDQQTIEMPQPVEPMGLSMPIDSPPENPRETLPSPRPESDKIDSSDTAQSAFGFDAYSNSNRAALDIPQDQPRFFPPSTIPLPYFSTGTRYDGIVQPVFELGGQP